ncbi:hypothetical protein FUB10_001320 [Vibrio alginolyticus]
MKIKSWLIVAAVGSIAVVLVYICYFWLILDFKLSGNVEVWAHFATYAGGLVTPFLTFLSLIFIVKSLDLQRLANLELRAQIKTTEKNEKLKFAENHLFNMINAQAQSVNSFSLSFFEGGERYDYEGSLAIIELEKRIEALSELNVLEDPALRLDIDDEFISEYIGDADELDKIYSCTRAFYIMIKLIDNKLSDTEGFDRAIREEYFTTVINYTDYALIRLIMMAIQFTDWHPCKYLKSNIEFTSVIENMGLSYELYNRFE